MPPFPPHYLSLSFIIYIVLIWLFHTVYGLLHILLSFYPCHLWTANVLTLARILLERYSEIEYCIAVLIANTGYHKLSVHLLDTQIVHITKIQYLCSHHIKCIHKNSSEDLVVLGTKLRNIIYKFLTVVFYTISKPLKNSAAGL